mmetsp:Transcript_32898/g.69221  ORF Transcript_32898/g.69221 Transcript_32898/m.69221 type:complete len:203 (-) Transcript_32898:444-1052(-)
MDIHEPPRTRELYCKRKMEQAILTSHHRYCYSTIIDIQARKNIIIRNAYGEKRMVPRDAMRSWARCIRCKSWRRRGGRLILRYERGVCLMILPGDCLWRGCQNMECIMMRIGEIIHDMDCYATNSFLERSGCGSLLQSVQTTAVAGIGRGYFGNYIIGRCKVSQVPPSMLRRCSMSAISKSCVRSYTTKMGMETKRPQQLLC